MTPAEFERHIKEVHQGNLFKDNPSSIKSSLISIYEYILTGKAVELFSVNPKDVVNVELKPGDISIHHPSLVHGSEANQSDRRR